MSLREKTLNGFKWSAIDKILSKSSSFIVGIILARILSPSDYGLIGMISIFMAISTIIVDSGFSQALVQKQSRNDTDLSTAFIFNIILSFICYLIIYLIAPYVADFYNTRSLTLLLRISALSIIINSFSLTQYAVMLIKMNFRSIAIITTTSIVIGGIIGVYMAYNGYGVWALVMQGLITSLIKTCMYYFLIERHKIFIFSYDSFKSLFSYGSNIFLTGILITILREVHSIIIGKAFKASDLGYYTRAVQFSNLAYMTLMDVVSNTTFPILASIQQEKERMIVISKKLFSMTTFITLPIMLTIISVASPLVNVLLTDKWSEVSFLLQWLCLGRIFSSINTINTNLLKANGYANLFFKAYLIQIPLVVLSLIITIPYGFEYVVIGTFVVNFAEFLINAYVVARKFNFTLLTQFKTIYKLFIIAFFVYILTIFSINYFTSDIIKLIAGSIIFPLSYYGLSYVLGVQEVREINNIINKLLLSRT